MGETSLSVRAGSGSMVESEAREVVRRRLEVGMGRGERRVGWWWGGCEEEVRALRGLEGRL